MKRSGHASWILAVLMLGGLGAVAHAQDGQEARMRAALAAPGRAAEDKARDAARRPIQVIQFLGITDGMTAVDVIAFQGWYTEVLSAAVGPNGRVYSQNPAFFAQRPAVMEAEKEKAARLGNVEAVHGDLAAAGISNQADAAITALNIHDLYNMGGEEAALPLLRDVYGALKPGGVFGVIDHVGTAGQDNAAFHRIEKSVVRDLLVKAGFTIEAESDLLANPADDHMRSVRDPSLGRDTDRMLFRARKAN